ncbi:PREDICTED: uncharacterized protein LOC106821265 [Priapulus caudatus]|uniref:Uncharacterized protein LOC106821265 n=1 Tax=Priapulus caudatus TaxID=37621 RepID=A0ABM1FAL5_PRICU|nr:PREDICTED: uncharacterized protein LOC106821265 [Priapulus caudatus]
MRAFVVISVVCIYALTVWATPVKRFGVPVKAEDDCRGGANFSTDVDDCQRFYICDHGWPKVRLCAAGSVWTPLLMRCELPENAINDECGFVPPIPDNVAIDEVERADEAAQWLCADGNQRIAYHGVCDGFIQCDDGSDEADCAEVCDPTNCRLPDCKCSSGEIPGELLANEVPQLVLIGWDEAVRVEDYSHLYQQVFKKITANRRRENRNNPNGCPAVGTFFVSHQFTDYAALQSLYSQGHEIASHSISKTLPAEYWETATSEDVAAEYAGARKIFSNLAGIPESAVVGTRAAYLQTSGNEFVRTLTENGFGWDSSYATSQIDPPIWPYTFNFRSTAGCPVAPCPTASLTGFWEFPLVDWIDLNDTLCVNVDSCLFTEDKEEATTLLKTNFRRHYNTNKAPFTLNLRARWFYNDGYHNLEALQEFLDELEAMDDVYIVTYSQAMNWIRNPVKMANLLDSDVFSCDYSDRTPLCDNLNLCGYANITYQPNSEDHPGDRFFQTCSECPAVYPWTGNPDGVDQS